MRHYILLALCLVQISTVSALTPLNPNNPDAVLLESYIHYFTVKEFFQQCSAAVPDQAANYSKAFLVWEERNKKNIFFVNTAFSKRFASTPKVQQELIDAAPMIAREQYKSSPSQSVCMDYLATLNTGRLMDYSLFLREHLEILQQRSE